MTEFGTVRPLVGLIGQIFSEGQDPGAALLVALGNGLDQGEGWTTISPTRLIWNASQLAVVVDVHTNEIDGQQQQFVELTIEIVDELKVVDVRLLSVINHLNLQSAGWVVWIDEGARKIVCSMRTPVLQSHWWWVIALWRVIPSAITMADANAKLLADLSGGSISIRKHPQQGLRPGRDSWIDGILRGPGEPVSSAGLMITSLDISNLRKVLESRDTSRKIELSWPFKVSFCDENGAKYAQLRDHWHAEFGLGWQFTAIDSEFQFEATLKDGRSEEALVSAMRLNRNLISSSSNIPIFGGWVVVSSFNLIRNTFLPLPIIEEIQVLSQRSFGTVSGLMAVWFEESFSRPSSLKIEVGIGQHNEDFESAAHSVHINNELSQFSTLIDRSVNDAIDFENGSGKWLRPRHSLVCSFGIFNPAGPTISSLELSLSSEEWILYWAIRHPHGPEIVEIGRSATEDASVLIPHLIERCLSDRNEGVLGSGCQWMDVRLPQFEAAVIRGLRGFVLASPDIDWRSECRRIVGGQCDPWAMLELDDEALPEFEIDNVIDLWVSLVTDPNVVFGYQAFIRSAWEGSKRFAQGDFEGAQATASAINYGVRERLIDDFEFRNRDGLLIQHPTH